MVHGLETIIKLNEEAILNAGKRKHRKRFQGPLYWYQKGNYSSRRSSEIIPTIDYWPQLYSTGKMNVQKDNSN